MKRFSSSMHRILALVLTMAMLLSMAACAQPKPQMNQGSDRYVPDATAPVQTETIPSGPSQNGEAETEPREPVPEEEQSSLPTENDRDSLEQIVTVLGGNTDTSNMDDEELGQLVEDLIQDLDKKEDQEIVDLGGQDNRPATDVEPDAGAYDENGAMTDPFDQV